MTPASILIIGGGNMGAALAARWREAFPQARLAIAETDAAKRAALQAQGFDAPEELDLPEDGFELIVLAVKPQGFAALAPQLAPVVGDATLVSIMAGVKHAALQAVSPHAARVMPNTPASIGEGISAIYAPGLSTRRLDRVKLLFGATGHIVILDDEELMHAVTAISGSGPAYLFAFMEALEAAAQTLGLDATTARALVTQTVRGAALLADRAGGDAATLRRQVTSPGGTTEAALKILADRQFSEAIQQAVRAAQRRSEALS